MGHEPKAETMGTGVSLWSVALLLMMHMVVLGIHAELFMQHACGSLNDCDNSCFYLVKPNAYAMGSGEV